jgi:hypothetical protein
MNTQVPAHGLGGCKNQKSTDQKPTDLRKPPSYNTAETNPLINSSKELTLGGIDGIRRVLHLEKKNEKRTT